MSAHVLLNLSNELGKRDKMRGLSSILSLFPNEFSTRIMIIANKNSENLCPPPLYVCL